MNYLPEHIPTHWISNTSVISFNVLIKWRGFQIPRFQEDYPSVFEKLLVGFTIHLGSVASREEMSLNLKT